MSILKGNAVLFAFPFETIGEFYMKNKWNDFKPLYRAIILIILSAFCFALMNMFVRLAGDLPSTQKSFFRNLIAFIIAAAAIIKDKVPLKVDKTAGIPLFLRSFIGTLGILCNFYALDRLALADASILNKMSPFFVIIFSIIILKEEITVPQLLFVIGALVGAMFVVKPTFANTALVPAAIALCGGICAGFAYTMVRLLGKKGVKGVLIVAFFSGFSCLFTLPFLLFDYHPMTVQQFIILICAGLSAAGGQFTITAAYTNAPARDVSIYDYTQIIFAAGLGFLVFGQIPDVFSWIGYFIIISMAASMFVYNKMNNETASAKK